MTSSPLRPTTLDLSGERIGASYRITGDAERAEAVLEQLVVEQTIEFPRELVPDDDITREIIGRVESTERHDADELHVQISYAVEIAGGQLPQLLNVLFGNISMVPGVRLVDVDLPPNLLDRFHGPGIGVTGLRERFAPDGGPVLATALKPMGTPIADLARIAEDLALGGMHLIKDDHSFATQPFAAFRERVPAMVAAIDRANEQRGEARSIYLPALNLPADELHAGVEFALEAGAGGVLLLPGLFGFDTMRVLAASTPDDVVVMAHPSLLGSHVTDPGSGIAHELVFGTFPRLAGADVSIFPNHGGRFSFSPEQCRSIAEACRAPLGALTPALPAPGGGMTVERVAEMVRFYGPDVCLLIGGALYHGDVRTQVERMRAALEEVPT